LELSGVDAEQHVAGFHELAFVDFDRSHDPRDVGRDHQLGSPHIGVVGRGVATAMQPSDSRSHGNDGDAARHQKRPRREAAARRHLRHDGSWLHDGTVRTSGGSARRRFGDRGPLLDRLSVVGRGWFELGRCGRGERFDLVNF
jgi:hypothetical protein